MACLTSSNFEIEKKAKQWAQQSGGQMKHSSSSFRKNVGGFSYVGENLALGATGKNAVDMWYNEINLTPGKKGIVHSFSGGTGHYTQVVWKGTTELGCGINGRLLVCMYGQGGNMGGQFANNVPAVKKSSGQCPDGGAGGGGGGPSPPPSSDRRRRAPSPKPSPPQPQPNGGGGKRCVLYFGSEH
jgi:hypothetical protein